MDLDITLETESRHVIRMIAAACVAHGLHNEEVLIFYLSFCYLSSASESLEKYIKKGE